MGKNLEMVQSVLILAHLYLDAEFSGNRPTGTGSELSNM